MKIIVIAGARPNFMKIAPLMRAFKEEPRIEPLLVHTGQHYDEKMSGLFFRELGIPEPDINLEVGSASHAVQTAEIMKAFEPVVLKEQPDAVLVVGDVNSTVACGLVAVKLGVKLVHVEAGLRSFARSMPEEINRILTDSISDLLFCTEQSGVDNLLREGMARDKIFLVGNVMIDTLLQNKARADSSAILETLGLKPGGYGVLTLHRPSNVDDLEALARLLDVFAQIQNGLPVVFPVHPRTKKRIFESGLGAKLEKMAGFNLIEPVGYLDFLKLMSNARMVFTDSGGIQEETAILNVPCLTLRENTERPVTVEMGGNWLVGTDPDRIFKAFNKALKHDRTEKKAPPLWDGQAAERIVAVIKEKLR